MEAANRRRQRDDVHDGWVLVEDTLSGDHHGRMPDACLVSLQQAEIEPTVLRAFYDLRTEQDFTGDPRQIDLASAGSLLASLH